MIHLIQQFANYYGGSERHCLELYDVLKSHTDIKLWSEFEPEEIFNQSWPIELIRPKKLKFPKSGTLIFVGSCWHVGKWINFTNAKRIIVIHNFQHPSFKRWLTHIKAPWLPEIEWAFVSPEMKTSSGLDGKVICSPINISKFARHNTENSETNKQDFVVGRHSRDQSKKFHQDDPTLFLALADKGVKVKIMGGANLSGKLPAHINIELLREGAMTATNFLNTLDCFLYRTSTELFEASGRVIDEAMANSLPIVCGDVGGYVGRISPGENGYLFANNAQAVEYVLKLRDNKNHRKSISANAFATVDKLYTDGLPKDVLDFYLS